MDQLTNFGTQVLNSWKAGAVRLGWDMIKGAIMPSLSGAVGGGIADIFDWVVVNQIWDTFKH